MHGCFARSVWFTKRHSTDTLIHASSKSYNSIMQHFPLIVEQQRCSLSLCKEEKFILCKLIAIIIHFSSAGIRPSACTKSYKQWWLITASSSLSTIKMPLLYPAFLTLCVCVYVFVCLLWASGIRSLSPLSLTGEWELCGPGTSGSVYLARR